MTFSNTVRRNVEQARNARERAVRLLNDCGKLKASCRESQRAVAKTLARIDEQLLKDLKLEDMLAQEEPDD